MNSYRIGQVLPIESENGIWVDYMDHVWIFMLKDSVWQPEEITNTMHKQIKISYVQKGIIDCFLVSIHDCLETSDVPFCLLDATKDLSNSFKDAEPYHMNLMLLDKNNTIVALREGTFGKEFSMGMKRLLQERRISQYDERSYNAAYTKLVKKYEPYQLEEYACFTQEF